MCRNVDKVWLAVAAVGGLVSALIHFFLWGWGSLQNSVPVMHKFILLAYVGVGLVGGVGLLAREIRVHMVAIGTVAAVASLLLLAVSGSDYHLEFTDPLVYPSYYYAPVYVMTLLALSGVGLVLSGLRAHSEEVDPNA